MKQSIAVNVTLLSIFLSGTAAVAQEDHTFISS